MAEGAGLNETVIEGSRAKSAFMLLISLGFVAIGVFLLRQPDVSRSVAWLCLAFFAVCALVALAMLVKPNRIVLGPKGFKATALWRSFDVAWDDVEGFHVWKNPAAHQTLAAWSYRPGRAPASPMAGVSASLGAEGAVPGMYGMSTRALVDLLNQRLEASRA
jgi:hypothetical protein